MTTEMTTDDIVIVMIIGFLTAYMLCIYCIVKVLINRELIKEQSEILQEIKFNIKDLGEKIEKDKDRNQFIYSDNVREKFASMKEGKITDCYIEVSTKDLKKLDTFIHMKRPLNVIFYCKNDEQHFLFAEVDTGRDYYIKEGANVKIIHDEYNTMKKQNIKEI